MFFAGNVEINNKYVEIKFLFCFVSEHNIYILKWNLNKHFFTLQIKSCFIQKH